MATNAERRIVELEGAEIRAEGDGRTFIGYASVFNSPTMIGNFRESVSPSAFNRAISEQQDVRMLLNHDANHLLGRTGKNVKLSVDERGLRVEARLPNTTDGNNVAELVREGILTQMSFGFNVPDGGDEWRKGADGIAERSLNDVNLFDVSPVVFPAYSDTTAEVRAHAEEVADEEVDSEALEAEVLQQEIEANYSRLVALEERAGAVLSTQNKTRIQAAIDHLEAVMEAANSQASDDHDVEIVDAGATTYSNDPDAEKRGRLLALLSAGVDVTEELRSLIEVRKDYSTDQRIAMAKKGEAIPVRNDKGEIVDGSYPIADGADLHNAIQAFGRAGDQAEVKAHIIKRAKALGMTSELPDGWM